MNAVLEPWQIFKRRWLPATVTLGAVVGAVSFYNFWQQPVYEAKGQILFKEQNQSMLLTTLSPTKITNSPDRLIRSRPIVQAALTALKLDLTASEILANLSISSASTTNGALELSYRDSNPQRAARLVEKVMEVYLQQDLATRRQTAQTNRTELEKQLPMLASKLQVAESNLRKFKEDLQITDLSAEKNTLVQAIGNLQSEVDRAAAQLAATKSQSQKLQKVFGQDAVTAVRSGLVDESPDMQRVLAALQGIEQKLALEKTKFNDNNPVIKDLQSKQAILREAVRRAAQQSLMDDDRFRAQVAKWQQSGVQPDLVAQLVQAETNRDGLERRIAGLKNTIAEGRKRLAVFPKIEKKIGSLEQDLKTAQSNHQQLLDQLKLSQTAANQAVPSAQIVSHATIPTRPVADNHYIHPAWSVFAGIFLSGGIAWSLDKADRRLKNAATAQKIINYPLLGCIPNWPKLTIQQTARRLAAQDDTVFTAPLQMLQSNLGFLNKQRFAQVVVMASSLHQEGTSTIAAQLAIAAARHGQRILIVDANLHHPSQHRLWQISNITGLSNVLTGENQFPESIVEVAENLEFLPAGPLPTNPLALFSSPAMAELLSNWFSLYDMVLIDAPPLTTAPESLLLAQMADGLVLLVRPPVTEAAALHQAQDLLSQSHPLVLGMVFNGVEPHEYDRLAPAIANNLPHTSAATTASPQSPPLPEFAEKSARPRL
jgi:capsular exopolysaccharide synthesis family protein